MITVRFPNGQAVQYNDGNFAEYWGDMISISNKKDGILIAEVPKTCIIEWAKPCRVYNPLASVPNEELVELKKEIQSMKRKLYRIK